MNEMDLGYAVHLGIKKINRDGTAFTPDMGRLFIDLGMSSGTSGIAALTPERANHKGYDLVRLPEPDNVPSLDITVDDLWACAQEHYGLTAATVAAGVGGIPISKILLGRRVQPGSSKYTNLVSHYGLKFFPMARLPHRSTAARVAKSTLGTIRIFGIVGRAAPFAAIGLAVYDAISIGMCAYEERNGK